MATALTELTIDASLPVRGMPFEGLRDLLFAVAPFFPIRYTDALRQVTQDGAIRGSNGEFLKKSAFYHYWSALNILGLITQDKPSYPYDLTARGKRLLSVGIPKDSVLSWNEQLLFREGMLSNHSLWDNFLCLFTGGDLPTVTPLIGHRVSWIPSGGGYEIQSPFRDTPLMVPKGTATQLLIWGLRRWGKQCLVLDEIFPPISAAVYNEGSAFMYLLDPTQEQQFSVKDVALWIKTNLNRATTSGRTTAHFYIPDLLEHLCVSKGIRLHTAQRILREWVEENRFTAALERPSSGLILPQHGTRAAVRVRENQPWIVREGLIYTTLLVRIDRLDLERGDAHAA